MPEQQQNPSVGDKVRHNNGYLGEVISLKKIATRNGLAPIYNLKFVDGPYPDLNCVREEFTFPIG